MDSASPNSIERQEIDRVLRLKRKQRESKACYPCRQRKVKCDGGRPCRTCTRRDHPQICSYNVEKGSPRHRVASPCHMNQTSGQDVPPRDCHENTASSVSPTHSADASSFQLPPTSQDNSRGSGQPNPDSTSSYIFSGDNSLVSILHQQDPGGTMAREATSVLGLHNTYLTYPYTEWKTPQDRWVALLDILPHRDEVLKFFHFYRICAYPFNPIVDIDLLESDICVYLSAYASSELGDRNNISEQWASGRSASNIGLLLATLATGAHFSDLENTQRSELSQDFARRSFQALRLANFLFHPSLSVVQSLLILGNILQNNGQSDAAWALLGTTVRLAQTLGLHTERGISHWPEQEKLKAKSLWSMTVWQDSLLSLCYDRPPIVSNRGWNPEAISPTRAELSYLNLMHYLCWVSLDILKMEEMPESEPTYNLTLLAGLDNTYNRAQLHLLHREKCRNLQQHLEHFALRMHVSFCISVLCRPAIRRSPHTGEDSRYVYLRTRARESLLIASRAFLDFQALSNVPLRTFSMIHTVLSSTLLLCTWKETREDTECSELQRKVIEIFSGANASRKDTGSLEYGPWLSGRHIRALIMLQQTLKNHHAPTIPEANSAPDRGQRSTSFANLQGEGVPLDKTSMGDLSSYNDLFPGLTYGFPNEMDLSPVTYLDSIMNVPPFNFPE